MEYILAAYIITALAMLGSVFFSLKKLWQVQKTLTRMEARRQPSHGNQT